MSVSVELAEQGGCNAMSQVDSTRVIGLLNAIPNGVLRMAGTLGGTVESSVNVGVLDITANGKGIIRV